MRLSWNEIRVRAKSFAQDWRDAYYEKGETQSFYNDFFDVFGIKRRSVGRYEEAVKDLKGNSQFIDLFWPGMLIVEQKSAGRDLSKAETQAFRYFDILKKAQQPRYIMVCDFQTFQLRDLSKREVLSFPLADLHKHVQKFGFMIGVERREFKDQDPVNIKASELVGKLHDALEDSGFTGEDLEAFLVQIVFCLFADDTGVFQPKDIFLQFLESRTKEDGTDLGPLLSQLFQTLDTPEGKRSKNLDEDLAAFPYINGRLFERHTRIPSFDSDMRDKLIEASRFDWSPISPAIFGALFQSVMDTAERRKKGAHYTTEKNILKVIGPLFMDDLRTEFDKAKALKRGRNSALEALSDKLGRLTFFDPACGCGNFLIIAYRELRLLEIELLKERFPAGTTLQLDAAILSNIDVDQFYGIEIGEFPARIAETAMWMMDHIMNNELSLAFGQNFARIPLDKAANIVHGDALEVDWETVLPAEHCDYVFGNPPFIGAKYQSKQQRQQVRDIAQLGGSGGTLDYVCAWFIKAGAYINEGGKDPAHIAFVSTNSITQGEQVAQLWPLLFQRYNLEISFAHRTFEWGSDARGKAHVHCVIIGLSHRVNQPEWKRLFSYDDIKGEPEETQAKYLSPYLFDASGFLNRHSVVYSNSSPISDVSNLKNGSVAADGGNLIFSEEIKNQYINQESEIQEWIRPFQGGKDIINNTFRYCFWLVDCPPQIIAKSAVLKNAISSVREMRMASSKKATQARAMTSHLFTERRQPDNGNYLAIPRTSSESRDYLPIPYLCSSIIAANDLQIVPNAEIHEFAIIQSKMHDSWTRLTAGRLESRIRYSAKFTYNTFPWPTLGDKAKAILTKTGQAIWTRGQIGRRRRSPIFMTRTLCLQICAKRIRPMTKPSISSTVRNRLKASASESSISSCSMKSSKPPSSSPPNPSHANANPKRLRRARDE